MIPFKIYFPEMGGEINSIFDSFRKLISPPPPPVVPVLWQGPLKLISYMNLWFSSVRSLVPYNSYWIGFFSGQCSNSSWGRIWHSQELIGRVIRNISISISIAIRTARWGLWGDKHTFEEQDGCMGSQNSFQWLLRENGNARVLGDKMFPLLP